MKQLNSFSTQSQLVVFAFTKYFIMHICNLPQTFYYYYWLTLQTTSFLIKKISVAIGPAQNKNFKHFLELVINPSDWYSTPVIRLLHLVSLKRNKYRKTICVWFRHKSIKLHENVLKISSAFCHMWQNSKGPSPVKLLF